MRRTQIIIAIILVSAAVVGFHVAFRSTVSLGRTSALNSEQQLPPSIRGLPLNGPVTFAIIRFPPRVEYVLSGTATTAEFTEIGQYVLLDPRVPLNGISNEFVPSMARIIHEADLPESEFMFPNTSLYNTFAGESRKFGYAWACYNPNSGRLTLRLAQPRGPED
jgi:hypothetical protein